MPTLLETIVVDRFTRVAGVAAFYAIIIGLFLFGGIRGARLQR